MSNKKQKKVLGRGLDALLKSSDDIQYKNENQITPNSLEININKIQVNPNQPRTNFDSSEIENLTISIKDLGVIQPITVREISSENFEIISGERRFRASKLAGLSSIPCYIKGVDNETDILKMSLVENVQRVDLDPIEIGLTYERLISDYNLNIDSISRIVGKERSTVSNYIRLLKLDPIIQSGIRDGFLSMGHGRALINIDDKKLQLEIYEQIISSKLSVRQTEKIVRGNRNTNKSSTNSDVSKIYIDATNKFEKLFYSKVKLKENSVGKVTLTATFKSINDLYLILKKLSS
jgi:ParB family chromosome partitioning protein